MANERASIFGDTPEPTELDVSEFKPRPASEPAPAVDKAALRETGEALGFRSREPAAGRGPESATTAAPAQPAAAHPKPASPAPRRAPMIYDDRLSVRVRTHDKKRFDDLGYKLRLPSGEVITRMLDLYEAVFSSDPETADLARQLLAKIVRS